MQQVETPAQQGDKFAAVFAYDETASANLPAAPGSMTSLMLTGNGMEKAFRFAEMMAKGRVAVPTHLKDNPADCLAVVIQALQWDMSPFTVAQKSHVSKGGQLAFDGQLVASVVATRAPIMGLPRYEHHGDWSKVRGKFEKVKGQGDKGDYLRPSYKPEDEVGLFVRVIVHLKGEAEPRILDVYMDQCQPRFSTMWASDPEQQICYAAIRKWARRNTPNVILGVYADDEMDVQPAPRHMGNAEEVRTPAAPPPTPDDDPMLIKAKAEAGKGREAFLKWWASVPKSQRLAIHSRLPDLEEIAKAADDKRTFDASATPAAAAAETGAAGQPGITAEQVEQQLKDARAANNGDALNEAADLIGAVSDDAARSRLEDLYETLMGEMA